MNPESQSAVALAVAALIGLAVGIEREWSGHASGPRARFAGVRTFLLLGVVGGSSGLLVARENGLVATVLLAGAAALTVAAYAVTAGKGGPEAVDGTTEAAALAVLALGTLAGLGELRLAAAAAAVLVLALREKSAIQNLLQRVGEVEFRAGLQFAAMALVLLPILPRGPYGPLGGIQPRSLWVVVLLVCAFNFAGYLARRAIGDTRGTGLAGILGGLISSTAVALAFSRHSRQQPEMGPPLALGVVGACTALLLRLTVLTLFLQPGLTPRLAPFFLPPFLLGCVAVVAALRRVPRVLPPPAETQVQSPLRLGSAILMALGFQVVLMVMVLVREQFGNPGILLSSALLGLTDMDALTLSLTRLAASPELEILAATAMAIGVLSNTLLKLAVVLVLGSGSFRVQAGAGLLLLAAASGFGLWLGRT